MDRASVFSPAGDWESKPLDGLREAWRVSTALDKLTRESVQRAREAGHSWTQSAKLSASPSKPPGNGTQARSESRRIIHLAMERGPTMRVLHVNPILNVSDIAATIG